MKSKSFLLVKNVLKDKLVNRILLFSFFSVIAGSLMLNVFFGLLIVMSLSMGFVISIISLSYTAKVEELINKFRSLFSRTKSQIENSISQCDICKMKQCQRHIGKQCSMNKIIIDAVLDEAIESLFSKIISSFVQSWFMLLSHDNDFVQTLKQSLRQATSHLIEKVSQIDGPQFITKKLCPILFYHIDTIEIMLQDGVLMDKMSSNFIIQDYPIHPAVCSRQAEKDYLRAVAKCLIKKIFHSENFDSKIFFSLVRELIACWILLPLMDCLSDPNLLNLMIVHILNDTPSKIHNKMTENNRKVEFLKDFVDKNNICDDTNTDRDPTVLTESKKLYCFMQYLKQHGVVDLLRFYLDVDNLNKELQESTDPGKLSTLYQESEKLLQDYEKIMDLNESNSNIDIISLTEAHENVKNLLEGKWRRAFHNTPEYFKFIYGSRQIEIIDDYKNEDQNWGVSRLRSKLKGAFKGTIDGASYEAIEIPTVWDALAEPNISSSNPTIYNSVTLKLRRERGQNLDSFLLSFLQSLEQSTDVGEDVIELSETRKGNKNVYKTNKSLIFGNLFSLDKVSKKFLVSSYISFSTIGPSKCALYLATRVINIRSAFIKLLYSVISWSQKIVDIVLCQLISKLISFGLYQPRLAVLIKLLEVHLFEEKHLEHTPAELLERQKKARQYIENTFCCSGRLIHILQSPALNKHLMYCAFDAIITELYPELSS